MFVRVSDEKDARGYLQALTSKMTEEMENLKMQGMTATPTNVIIIFKIIIIIIIIVN